VSRNTRYPRRHRDEEETRRPGIAGAAFFEGTASISAARHRAAKQFRQWGLDQQAEVASLIVSELITNAVRHANSDFELELTRGDSCVRIEVSDRSLEPPVPRERDHGSEAPSGYGLAIVADLSAQWGWRLKDGGGKVVWADVEVSDTSTSAH
jgi:anti-sigma regulatory factor (Ser/Thr protein kinase)